jgi:hypothetical protein
MISMRLSGKRAWLQDTINGRIFGAATMLAGLATVVKVAGFGKEMLGVCPRKITG